MQGKQQREIWVPSNASTAVRNGDAARDAAASPEKILGAKLIRFGQIWLDLGKIRGKLRRNLGKSD